MLTQRRVRMNVFKFMRSLGLTLMIATFLFFTIKSYAVGSTKDSYIEVTVQQGDTLWEIANQYNGNENIQKVVFEIKDFNNLPGSDLYPGQNLKIPIKY